MIDYCANSLYFFIICWCDVFIYFRLNTLSCSGEPARSLIFYETGYGCLIPVKIFANVLQ